MKLSEFRSQLESEAMLRCEQQEIVIRKLHEEIKMLKNQILCMKENQLKDDIKRASANFIQNGIEYLKRRGRENE